MHKRESRLRLEAAKPLQQAALVGMRGQAAHRVHARSHADVAAVDAHPLRAIDQPAAQCADALVTDEHHVRTAHAEVLLEVMQDAAAIGHAAAGDDDRAAPHPVDRHRLFSAGGQVQVRHGERGWLAPPHGLRIGIEQLVVAVIDLHHLARHRAVQIDPPARELPFFPVFREPVQQFLGAADRERRDQHVAAIAPGGVEDAAQLADGIRAILVVAVAIGGFHQYQVGFNDRRRVAQDRRSLWAEVAGEHQLLAVRPQFDDGRAKDMAGIAEGDLDAVKDRLAGVVWQRMQERDCSLDVVPGVQRQDLRLAVATVAVCALGVTFRQRGRVQQHDRHQVGGRALRHDGATKAARHQQRDATDMVDMRMTDHDRIDRGDIEWKRIGVAGFHLAAALAHATVEQDALATSLDQVHRTGHLAGGPMEMHSHAPAPVWTCAEPSSLPRVLPHARRPCRHDLWHPPVTAALATVARRCAFAALPLP